MNIDTSILLEELNASFVTAAPLGALTAAKPASVWARGNGESAVVTAATIIAGLLSCGVTIAAFTEVIVAPDATLPWLRERHD